MWTLLAASRALAGPPFLTDDPEPVAYGHYEFYAFSALDAAADGASVTGPAFEFNVGALPELQLHVVAPFSWNAPDGGPVTFDYGDTEVGAKYRFIDETARVPQVGAFPMLELATGDSGRGLGNGRTWAKAPVWAQKSWGPWTTYGGGGYAWNGAPGARDYAFGGWLVERQLTERLTLGAEVFAQSAVADGGASTTIAQAGGFYSLTSEMSLLFALGRSIGGERHAVGYLALYWTW